MTALPRTRTGQPSCAPDLPVVHRMVVLDTNQRDRGALLSPGERGGGELSAEEED